MLMSELSHKIFTQKTQQKSTAYQKHLTKQDFILLQTHYPHKIQIIENEEINNETNNNNNNNIETNNENNQNNDSSNNQNNQNNDNTANKNEININNDTNNIQFDDIDGMGNHVFVQITPVLLKFTF